MVLSGVKRGRLLAMTILVLAVNAQAEPVKNEKNKNEIISKNIESSVPVTVLQSGARVHKGYDKNEFYILGERDADPQCPVYINSQPLQVGIGPKKVLGVRVIDDDADDPILEAANQEEVKPEEPKQVAKQETQTQTQTQTENQPHFFADASDSVADGFFNDAAIPVAMQPAQKDIKKDLSQDKQEAKEATNLSKVKNILHSLTRKIADKKKVHSKVRMVSKSRHTSVAIHTKKVKASGEKHVVAQLGVIKQYTG